MTGLIESAAGWRASVNIFSQYAMGFFYICLGISTESIFVALKAYPAIIAMDQNKAIN